MGSILWKDYQQRNSWWQKGREQPAVGPAWLRLCWRQCVQSWYLFVNMNLICVRVLAAILMSLMNSSEAQRQITFSTLTLTLSFFPSNFFINEWFTLSLWQLSARISKCAGASGQHPWPRPLTSKTISATCSVLLSWMLGKPYQATLRTIYDSWLQHWGQCDGVSWLSSRCQDSRHVTNFSAAGTIHISADMDCPCSRG